jgi:hypothetical protein
LYTSKSLVPTAVLELPSEAELLAAGGGGGGGNNMPGAGGSDGLPNAQYSSDHVALMAEFQIVPAANGGAGR